MALFDQRILGIIILVLLSMLVIVKRSATGSILDRPKGVFLVQLVNIFNLFSLLIVNPLTAILLITRRLAPLDPAGTAIDRLPVLVILEIAGLVIYVSGYFLMAWALIILGRNYQLGGIAPRSQDKLVVDGPYRLVRHPMYTAALSISFGLVCLIPSWIYVGLFCIYFVMISLLIPLEENELRKTYGEQYGIYHQQTRGLIPFVY